MASRICFRTILLLFAASLTTLCAPAPLCAQTARGGDDQGRAADPVKLFERAQDAHQNGDFKLALEYYDAALKLRPEFPEAEFQRGAALAAQNRVAEAERAFRRASNLREDWPLPLVNLASLLMRSNREGEAEPLLRRAIALDGKNSGALAALASVRLRARDGREAVDLLRRAIEAAAPHAPASLWAMRAVAERTAGDKDSAAESLRRALELDPHEPTARAERAEISAAAGDYQQAIGDLESILKTDHGRRLRIPLSLRLARFLGMAGRKDEARRMLNDLGTLPAEHMREADALRVELAGTSDSSPEAGAALESMLERDPGNAALLGRLGAFHRKTDPQRSLEYYARAAQLEPSNAEYATGYAAALVQARRFEQAALILQRVTAAAPDNYEAHANLATALDEMKRFREALVEYNWIRRQRPELAVTYFLIARAHDMLGQYEEALASYETFLVKADRSVNNSEIEKVNLRLPGLRRQIARGEGQRGRKKG